LVRIGAARSAGVVLLAGTALLVGMAPQLAGAQPGAPAPLVQTAPPASAASVAPPSRLPPEADAAVLPSPPPEQIQADSELPALRPLDRLIARMDPNHVDGVGLAYIAGQAAALFNVLAAQAEQDAASWQGEDAGHGVTDADETARAGEAHHASPDSRASGAPQSSGSPRSSAAAQSSATPQSRDTTHASGGTPASESEQRREDSAAAKARVLGKHFGACAADFELVARWLTLRHQTQDLKQRDAQQAELESLYRREAEKHRAAGLGQFPPSMRRDYDAAMDIHPAVKTLADHWRRELAERAGAEAPSGKRN
jgi:hypothetical protein